MRPRRDVLRDPLRLDPDLAEHSGGRHVEPAEVEPGQGSGSARHVRDPPAVAHRWPVHEELLECRAVPGTEHHGVDSQTGPVGEQDALGSEFCDLRMDLDPAGTDVIHGPDVQHRDLPVPGHLGVRPVGELAQPHGGDVSDGESDERPGQGVGDPGRQPARGDAELQDGHPAENVPRDHIDRRPHRHVHIGTMLDKVDRLLTRGVAEPHHKHRPALPGIAVAVLAGVQDRTRELPHGWPRRPHRPTGVACGEHDAAGPPVPVGRGGNPQCHPPSGAWRSPGRSAARGRWPRGSPRGS